MTFFRRRKLKIGWRYTAHVKRKGFKTMVKTFATPNQVQKQYRSV